MKRNSLRIAVLLFGIPLVNCQQERLEERQAKSSKRSNFSISSGAVRTRTHERSKLSFRVEALHPQPHSKRTYRWKYRVSGIGAGILCDKNGKALPVKRFMPLDHPETYRTFHYRSNRLEGVKSSNSDGVVITVANDLGEQHTIRRICNNSAPFKVWVDAEKDSIVADTWKIYLTVWPWSASELVEKGYRWRYHVEGKGVGVLYDEHGSALPVDQLMSLDPNTSYTYFYTINRWGAATPMGRHLLKFTVMDEDGHKVTTEISLNVPFEPPKVTDAHLYYRIYSDPPFRNARKICTLLGLHFGTYPISYVKYEVAHCRTKELKGKITGSATSIILRDFHFYHIIYLKSFFSHKGYEKDCGCSVGEAIGSFQAFDVRGHASGVLRATMERAPLYPSPEYDGCQ